MPKLYFRYGTMNSSKTANLLMVAHNYQILNRKIMLMKPSIDTRNLNENSEHFIQSRVGIKKKVDVLIDENTDLLKDISIYKDLECVLIDEAQFLSEYTVNQLREISKYVSVICYGLRTNYKTELFIGSKRLLELADTIEEIKTICVDCNKKAIFNAKYFTKNNEIEIIKDGSSEPDIGAEEKYRAMCWNCWNKK